MLEWYPFYPTEYRSDTLDFSLAEDGAYRRLIDHYMETRQPLPNNHAALARIIGVSINDFQAIAERVLSKFKEDGDVLRHKRCDTELDRQDNLSQKRSEAAKRAASKRHENSGLQAIAQQKPGKRLPQDNTQQDNTQQLDISFGVFWNAYPRKVDKKKAKNKFIGIIKRKEATSEELIQGAKRYRDSVHATEKKFIKHPATWLNAGSWENHEDNDDGSKKGCRL